MATWHEHRMVLCNNDELDRIEVWFEAMTADEAASLEMPNAVSKMNIVVGTSEHELHLDEQAVNDLIKCLRRVLKEPAK